MGTVLALTCLEYPNDNLIQIVLVDTPATLILSIMERIP